MLDTSKLDACCNELWIKDIKKIYYSNIWVIVIPNGSTLVYKIFSDKRLYDNELTFYKLFKNNNINIPKIENMWLVNEYYILRLENIRVWGIRFGFMSDVDINELSIMLNKIYSIKVEDKSKWDFVVVNDVHSTNFFKRSIDSDLGIFDFSTAWYWFIEKDIACLYIEFNLSDIKLEEFIKLLNFPVNYKKIYYYTIKKLLQIVKEWMNISEEKKLKCKKYIKIINLKLLKI